MTDSDATLIERYRRSLVGPASLIRHLVEIRPAAGSPRIFNASCLLSPTVSLFGANVPGATGAAGLTSESALLAAMGEAVERYAAAAIPWNELVHATQAELGAAAIGIDAFDLHPPEQYLEPGFPLTPWSADLTMYWRSCRSLLSGQTRYVPAPQIYVPYLYRDKEKRSDFVSMAVSTGAACHATLEQATLGGLHECIERDAFMITWMRRLPVPRIDWESDPELARLYQAHYAGCEVKFHLFDVTMDIPVPTVLCIAEGIGRTGRIAVVGCATRATLREACAKAMLEAAQCMAWAHYLLEHRRDWKPNADYSNVVEFEDHVRMYLEPEMLVHLDFLLQTERRVEIDPASVPPKAVAHALEQALAAVDAAGFDVLETDLTTRDIAELGLHVVKVIVPGLVPLTADHRFPALASPRFRDVPRRLGLADDDEFEFNPIPHPFP